MSRVALSCLVALSVSSIAMPLASARRLVPLPDDVNVPVTDAPVAPHQIEVRVAAPSRDAVRAALVKARAQNRASFRAYWKGGVYPSNVYSKKLLNVWRDEDGHFCAAATIMVKSGNQALAIKLAEDNNFIRLADVEQGPVMDWILTSGLTQEELVSIQKPFMGVSKQPVLEPLGAPIAVAARPVVDARLRKAETARLLAKYKVVDKQLAAKQAKSLELAVDRLMLQPALAWQLVHARTVAQSAKS
jgi:hypothetical protein